MTKTPNYQLNQWVPEDRVVHSDFNEDNAKIDAALKAQADALAAEAAARENAEAAEAQARQSIATQVAARGNCQIIHGSYTGSGTYGFYSPKMLSFTGKPLLVLIYASSSGGEGMHAAMLNGTTSVGTLSGVSASSCTLSWSAKSVSWYNSNSASYQLNVSGITYYYVALLAMD